MKLPEIRIRAPAKINLGLEVRERRRDGYHQLRTIYQAISLYDRLRLRRRPRGIVVRCRRLPRCGRDNLAWRAAALFVERTGAPGGLEIDLEKAIPVGGGLGGGSSDAAAVLLGAGRLFDIRVPLDELHRWAATLGSDVPFFLRAGAASGSGRGEEISPLPLFRRPVAVLIFDPGFAISTAEIYRTFRPHRLTTKEDKFTMLLSRWRSGTAAGLGRTLFNDLEETVFHRYPQLAEVKECFLRQGARGAQLSGTGACLFGLFGTRGEAARAARAVSAAFAGRCLAARFLPPRRRWGVVKR